MSIRTVGSFSGTEVEEISIALPSGFAAKILTWGSVLRDLVVPAAGGPRHVVLGFEEFASYPQYSPNFGANVGRVANRIKDACFVLDNVEYHTNVNFKDRHTLHGGAGGFGKSVWRIAAAADDAVTLLKVSPAGEMGFPGLVVCTLAYRLLAPATLQIETVAVSDAPTPLNIAHHSYFNLDGEADIGAHVLEVPAEAYTRADADLIQTGEIVPVSGTPFDFRTPRPVDATVGGEPVRYDLNFALRAARGPLARSATLSSSRSKLAMEVWSTEPGLQFYDGAKINVPVPGLGGVRYGARAGLCLEAQLYPDAPHHPHFPDITLRPGELYRQITEYRFRSA